MAEVRWTAEAERWLREIHDYIARDNPGAAMRTIIQIVEKAEALTDFPLRGYRYEQRPDRHIRVVLHGHYRIAYLLRDDGFIDILGVFHGAMDIDRLL